VRLQVGLQDFDIVVEPFEVLLLDRGNTLQDLVGVVDRPGLRSMKVRLSVRTRNHWRFVPGSCKVTSLPSRLTWLTSSTDEMRGIVTLSPMRGMIGGSGTADLLQSLAMSPTA
jgi:hypothetical protein